MFETVFCMLNYFTSSHTNMKHMAFIYVQYVEFKGRSSLANLRHGAMFHEYLYAYLGSVGQIMHYVYAVYR